MDYTLHTGFRDDMPRRRAFDALASDTFGLSFERWYRAGYWTDLYDPHTLFDGERAVANVSVNRMTLCFDGTAGRYIQLGTVMVARDYRGQGLARYLMELALDRYTGQCDGMYLIANGGVLGFYPKFGFRQAQEFQHSALLRRTGGRVRRLSVKSKEDLDILRRCYAMSNPYSALAFQNNWGLVMFYCMDFLRDCLYYFPAYDTVVIARQQGEALMCYDVFGRGGVPLGRLLSAVASPGTARMVLGFTPRDTGGFVTTPIETDDYLFVLEGKENPFFQGQKMLPLLSHA